jgi:hypothetical protein
MECRSLLFAVAAFVSNNLADASPAFAKNDQLRTKDTLLNWSIQR